MREQLQQEAQAILDMIKHPNGVASRYKPESSVSEVRSLFDIQGSDTVTRL